MARKPTANTPGTIGERLRSHRVESLQKGLREMARHLNIAPAHLTDIENGRRSPSEELLLRIAKAYGMPEADLRAGFGKPASDVARLASESPTAATKVPEFLRTARGLSPDQWDRLINQARKMTGNERKKDQ
jgi:transcriptional regulator with XRE-family HTH domain